MKNVKIYDAGSELLDRYTVVFMDRIDFPGRYECLGMSDRPFHPQGFFQHSSGQPGRHLGKRIKFDDLPADCQQAVKIDFDNQ